MEKTRKDGELYVSPAIKEALFQAEGVLCASKPGTNGGLESWTESEGEWKTTSFLYLF